MPFYQRLGKIPHKRHTQFEKPDGSLHHEQLFGTIGFVGMSSLLYHLRRPTMVKRVGKSVNVAPKPAVENNLLSRKLEGFKVTPKPGYLESRTPVLLNSDVTILLAAPTTSTADDAFYKNSDGDEVVFVYEGSGVFHTVHGKIPIDSGDY